MSGRPRSTPPRGHYEYCIMPFGLTNVPAVFKALVNDVLRDVINRHVFVYLDDILIFSDSLEEHVVHVQLVLQRQRIVKAEKYEFHWSTVQFLGFMVSRGRIEMDPAKIEAVVSWPPPTNRKELQRFLGFANFYRRFICGFSSTVQPLTALTSTKSMFRWTPEAEAAFSDLKTRFSTAPILIMPNPEKQFILKVDASDTGVGMVLSQRGPSGKVHPCAYFSLRLSPAERNYAIGDRELLALKLSLEEWRHLLEGLAMSFLVWTDHRNLEYLRSAKRLNPQQARWSLLFNLTISTSHSLIARVPRTSSLMPCHTSTPCRRVWRSWTPSFLPTRWSPLPGFRLRTRWRGLWRVRSLPPRPPLTFCMFQKKLALGSLNGLTPPAWSVTREFAARSPCWTGGSGGRLLAEIWRNSLQPLLSAPALRGTLYVLRGFCNRYRCPIVPGHTSP